MILAAGVAFVLPFELFAFAYAVLGPAHYLTQISWLHNRDYFATGKYDALALIIPAIPITWVYVANYAPAIPLASGLTFVAFGSALGAVLLKKPLYKVCLIIALLISMFFLSGLSSFIIFFTMLLPTIIHVFVFTGFFILFGALKSKSVSGYASMLVFLGLGITFFVLKPSASGYVLNDYVKEAVSPFGALVDTVVYIFDLDRNWDTTVAIMRFLAYAYTYHYLNWFSKTKVIGWHEMSRVQFIGVSVAYIACLTCYGIDYLLGFVVVFFLSLAHVFLEFPLNHVSIMGIGSELKKRLAPTDRS